MPTADELARADQVHAGVVHLLDGLIENVQSDLKRQALADDTPGEAYNVAELGRIFGREFRGPDGELAIGTACTALALAIHRIIKLSNTEQE